MSIESLFSPFRVKGLELKNRFVMAPLTRSFSPEGVPGDNVAGYYRRRAENEVGLIISEGTVIDRPASKNDPNIPFFHGDNSLAGWKKVVDEVHSAGGKMGPQIWHVGALQHATFTPDGPVDAPSGLSKPGKRIADPMTEEAIADTVAPFAKAAAASKALGFDVVELHGAHGYLIDQFFWTGTNERADAFGGASIKERARFAAHAIKAVRQAVGPDYPVILRVSQWKQQDFTARVATTPDEMSDWLNPLVEAGADVLHCSMRRFWQPEFPEIDGDEGLSFAGWAKKLTGKPTITVGSVGLTGEFIAAYGGESSKPASLDGLIKRLEQGDFDLVAVGRALLTDPAWVRKIRQGRNDELMDFKREDMAVLT